MNNYNYENILRDLVTSFENNEFNKDNLNSEMKYFSKKCSSQCYNLKSLSFNQCFDNCFDKYHLTSIKFKEIEIQFINKYKSYIYENV